MFAFRLIVIAESKSVEKTFPIPLINRLEKHYVSSATLLSSDEDDVRERLEVWMRKFVKPISQRRYTTFFKLIS